MNSDASQLDRLTNDVNVLEEILQSGLSLTPDLLLSLSQGAGNADMMVMMLAKKKKEYVDSVHHAAITQIQKGAKKGRWKTYVGTPRKGVERKSEKDLYDYLYEYYTAKNRKEPTFREVFSERLDFLVKKKNRSENTAGTYWSVYNRFVTKAFGDKPISKITEDDVLEMFRNVTQKNHPKPEALKKAVQHVKATFEFARKQKYCTSNPAVYLDPQDYYKDCDLNKKTDDEKEFSEKELSLLSDDLMKHTDNPRALMGLLAKETGMREGELAAIHRSDVDDEYIHIHRQQVLKKKQNGQSQRYYEVTYTKDERMHPHGGRKFPVTDQIRKIVELADKIPGKSEYLFHDPGNAEPVKKDTYCKYLHKHCKKLGFETTNNHAFRMALNSRMIAKGLSPADRALLLGHSVETNERHYSLADPRRLEDISEIMRE